MGLSGGRKSFPIALAVLIQYTSVTATQPPSQPPSHVAVAITLNAKASSLKIMKRHIPVQLLEVLENLFHGCLSCVKWDNVWSSIIG